MANDGERQSSPGKRRRENPSSSSRGPSSKEAARRRADASSRDRSRSPQHDARHDEAEPANGLADERSSAAQQPPSTAAAPDAESAPRDTTTPAAQPPLPDEPAPPPLPNEPLPAQAPEDDGWEPVWDDASQAFFFYNRFSHTAQWENPRVPDPARRPSNHDRIPGAPGTADDAALPAQAQARPGPAGGYNPAIHGDYDPSADYAQPAAAPLAPDESAYAANGIHALAAAHDYATAAHFNRFTGRFQPPTLEPANFNDESKSRRQMSAFFDVDAAANMHDGRSLKAERQGRKLTKEEVRAFREKRRERKEEKRKAWLRD